MIFQVIWYPSPSLAAVFGLASWKFKSDAADVRLYVLLQVPPDVLSSRSGIKSRRTGLEQWADDFDHSKEHLGIHMRTSFSNLFRDARRDIYDCSIINRNVYPLGMSYRWISRGKPVFNCWKYREVLATLK